MMIMKKNQKQSYIGWYVLTGVIILFALFAPFLFTRPGVIDFSETGQIGDTIAGTMGPFIAIAGVVVTFLAFLMQKKANDILSSQYDEDKKADKEKELYLFKTRIELMKSDVLMAKKDINDRIEKNDEFKQKLYENPFRTFRLQRMPSDMYRRMSESNREDFLLALTGLSIPNPTLTLNKYYSISDYMSPAVDSVNSMCDSLSNEIHDKLVIIGEAIQLIQHTATVYGWLGYNEKPCVKAFVQVIQEHNKTGENGESHFLLYWNAFDKLHKELNVEVSNAENASYIPVLVKLIAECEKALEQYQRINNAAAQMINTLDGAISGYRIIANRCDETLELFAN